MTSATRLFPSGQAASYVDRILGGEKRLPFQPARIVGNTDDHADAMIALLCTHRGRPGGQ